MPGRLKLKTGRGHLLGSEQGGEGVLKARCASLENRTERPISHGSDMGPLAGTGTAGYLKMRSTQEGFLPDEEALAERDLPVAGTEEVAIRCHTEEN